MIPVLLIGIPLLAGLIGFSLKDAAAKNWSLFASILVLCASLAGVCYACRQSARLHSARPGWVPLGSRFAISAGRDGPDPLFADGAGLSHYFYFHLERRI